MPVVIDIEQSDHHLFTRASGADAGAHPRLDVRVDCLDIGLINNMPDSALMPTERQVFDLLDTAAANLSVRLHLYSMDATPRSDWGRDYVRRYYRHTDDLLNRRLDGIIMTGAEPKAAQLVDEPYWASFTEIVDWAAENTASAIYSCLAVHGVVLHLDGVERRALPAKCIGVFPQTQVADHLLMKGLPDIFSTPHARWNEVGERDLSGCGYSVLSKSVDAGVDCFVKRRNNSLFVHFQGHPEYEAQSLLGEYRRDMGRFLWGANEVCPTIPKGYFDLESEKIVAAFRHEALLNRHPQLFSRFPTDRLARDVKNFWRPSATRIYGNWLSYLDAARSGRSRSRFPGSPVRSDAGFGSNDSTTRRAQFP